MMSGTGDVHGGAERQRGESKPGQWSSVSQQHAQGGRLFAGPAKAWAQATAPEVCLPEAGGAPSAGRRRRARPWPTGGVAACGVQPRPGDARPGRAASAKSSRVRSFGVILACASAVPIPTSSSVHGQRLSATTLRRKTSPMPTSRTVLAMAEPCGPAASRGGPATCIDGGALGDPQSRPASGSRHGIIIAVPPPRPPLPPRRRARSCRSRRPATGRSRRQRHAAEAGHEACIAEPACHSGTRSRAGSAGGHAGRRDFIA